MIHDRDSLSNRSLDFVFLSIEVQIERLSPSTPQMNTRMENFIRAIKTECLEKIIFTSERNFGWRSRNISNIGTIIISMPGLEEKWSNRILRL